MAKEPKRTAVPFNHRIAADVAEAFVAFCDGRNETIRQHLEMALRRHLASPPPKMVIPPLPEIKVQTGKRA